jgi:hypothetical protein
MTAHEAICVHTGFRLLPGQVREGSNVGLLTYEQGVEAFRVTDRLSFSYCRGPSGPRGFLCT